MATLLIDAGADASVKNPTSGATPRTWPSGSFSTVSTAFGLALRAHSWAECGILLLMLLICRFRENRFATFRHDRRDARPPGPAHDPPVLRCVRTVGGPGWATNVVAMISLGWTVKIPYVPGILLYPVEIATYQPVPR